MSILDLEKETGQIEEYNFSMNHEIELGTPEDFTFKAKVSPDLPGDILVSSIMTNMKNLAKLMLLDRLPNVLEPGVEYSVRASYDGWVPKGFEGGFKFKVCLTFAGPIRDPR